MIAYKDAIHRGVIGTTIEISDPKNRQQTQVIECKVCGMPFDNNSDYYEHYDEIHNKGGEDK